MNKGRSMVDEIDSNLCSGLKFTNNDGIILKNIDCQTDNWFNRPRPSLLLRNPQGSVMNRPKLAPFAFSSFSPGGDSVDIDKMRFTSGNLSESSIAEQERKLKEIMNQSGKLEIHGHRIMTCIDDLVLLGDLGNGTCGNVVKMQHKQTGHVMAVKQMRRTGNSDENKRIIMDLDVVLKSNDCDQIVFCLGCFITDADVWICMELMSTCFDKLLKQIKGGIPEEICGKVAVATLKGLNYLKEHHGVIHRDVKPSNILIDVRGRVKLCDFGISGRLVDSIAKTRSAGCAAYMAPERIEPPDPFHPSTYDIRADVWSLGITLVELALGHFPYSECKTDFEVLTKVLQNEPPFLPINKGFSIEFCSFVNDCLIKNYKDRPKYKKLLVHKFIIIYESLDVDVGAWYRSQRPKTMTTSTTTSAAIDRSYKPQPFPRVVRSSISRTPKTVATSDIVSYPSAINQHSSAFGEPRKRPSFDINDLRILSNDSNLHESSRMVNFSVNPSISRQSDSFHYSNLLNRTSASTSYLPYQTYGASSLEENKSIESTQNPNKLNLTYPLSSSPYRNTSILHNRPTDSPPPSTNTTGMLRGYIPSWRSFRSWSPLSLRRFGLNCSDRNSSSSGVEFTSFENRRRRQNFSSLNEKDYQCVSSAIYGSKGSVSK